MEQFVYIGSPIVFAMILLGITGWWRWAFAPFRIRSSQMTIPRLGLRVPPDDEKRVNGVLRHFAGGFNAMITSPQWSGWLRYCDSLPVLYRPFAHEAAAMGYTVRCLFRCSPEQFETAIVKPHPEMRYLYYVGLGFWSGMRDHKPETLHGIVAGLDPVHGNLCYDGYGFKHGFFDYLRDPTVVRKLNALGGYARDVAYQGLGRSFWFLFMDDPELLIERIASFGEQARHVAAGLGLATVFVFPDRLEEVALAVGRKLPKEWHDDYHLGMCFGLKARSINDVEQFERDMNRVDAQVREAAWASVRECDRIELQVRSERGAEPYRQWRQRVAQWMAEQVVFPLAGLSTSAASVPLTREPAAR